MHRASYFTVGHGVQRRLMWVTGCEMGNKTLFKVTVNFDVF